ncbi:MAG: phosphatase PAP2 family protein [Gemmataceae bacterium]
MLDSLGEALLAGDLGLLYFAGSLHRPWLTPLMRGLTWLGDGWPMVLLATLSAIVLLLLRRGRQAGVLVLVTLLAFFLMALIKGWIQRERPDVAWRLIERPPDPSFPSGHAMCGLTFYGLLGMIVARGCSRGLRRGMIALGLIIGLGVGCSRVYLGVHYPLDVLGGWLGGTAMILIGRALSEQPIATRENARLPDSADPTVQSG